MTIVEVFRDRLKKTPDLVAFEVTRHGKTRKWTYKEYYDECSYFAAAMIELGVKERSCVNIIGHNAPEWIIGCIGSMFGNMVCAGVYATNTPKTCQYIANHSNSEVVLLDTLEQYNKYQGNKEKLNTVKYFIIWCDPVPENTNNVISWEELINMGKLVHDKHKEEVVKRCNKQTPGTICMYIYTSGTTSMPKACMLTHDAIITSPYTQITTYLTQYKSIRDRDRVISFLPLCHVAAFDMDVMVNLMLGSHLFFAEPDALRGSLVRTLHAVRPTLFLAVPRVYEKMHERIVSVLAKRSERVQKLTKWAFAVGKEATLNQLAGKSNPFGFSVANSLIFKKLKREMGVDQVQLFMVGGAPTQKYTYDFFASINIKLLGLYGLSETAGPVTYALPNRTKLYASGCTVYGMEIKVHNPNESGEGEICCRGRCVFVGYFKEEEKSRAVFDKDGYYHTGDLGYIDSDGFLFITGRIKELLKTSGGEYVAPLLIESNFTELCDLASNIVVIGNNRKYLSALITLKSQPDKDGKLTSEVSQDSLELLKSLGSSARTIPEAAKCPQVGKYVAQCIEKVNARAISRAQQIRRWTILPREFTSDENEITPTMKLKRNVIYKKWADTIESMYINTTF